MDYIQSNLSKDEQIKARIEHSWVAIIGSVIFFLIFTAIGVVCIYLPDIFTYFIKEEPDSNTHIFLTIFGIILSLCFFVPGVGNLIGSIVAIKCDQLVLTNKRLLGRAGFISKTTVDILLSHVDTIVASNGFLGAFFHYGNIAVVSPATQQGGGIFFKHITNTMEFRKAVLDQIEEVKAHEREEQARLMQDAANADK